MAMELALASCDLYERKRPKLLHTKVNYFSFETGCIGKQPF